MDVTHIPHSIRGDPWFEDGNIILLAGPEDSEDSAAVAFKVHRGVLARHSEVFQSMFEGAQPTEESLEHCPVVRLHDVPVELSNLISALYDGPNRGLYVPAFLTPMSYSVDIDTNNRKVLAIQRAYAVSKTFSTSRESYAFPRSIVSHTFAQWPSDISW